MTREATDVCLRVLKESNKSNIEVIINYGSSFVTYGNKIESTTSPVSRPRCP